MPFMDRTTIGELCLGPIGMSIITKLSPKRLFGMMMGLWFLASAFGQFAAGKLGAEMAEATERGRAPARPATDIKSVATIFGTPP